MCFPISGTYDSYHYYLLLNKRKRRLFGCYFSLFHQNRLRRCGSVCLCSSPLPLLPPGRARGSGAHGPTSWATQTQGPRKEGGNQGTDSSLPGEPQAVRWLCWMGSHPLTPWSQHGWIWPRSFSWPRAMLLQGRATSVHFPPLGTTHHAGPDLSTVFSPLWCCITEGISHIHNNKLINPPNCSAM